MINLIPNEEKKKKVKDFYFRLLTVFFAMLGFSILIATVALLPAYFMSSVKKSFVYAKLETQKNEPLPPLDQKTQTLVEDLDQKLVLIEKIKTDKYLVSQKIISEIISKKMAGIKITEILYQKAPTKGKTISVSGTAQGREVLLAFRKIFEDNVLFKKVDLPISNFVKGSNIRFSLSLIPF